MIFINLKTRDNHGCPSRHRSREIKTWTSRYSVPAFFAKPYKLMAMVFQFKTVLLSDAALRLFDLRILKLHDPLTPAADQMVMMGLKTPALIISTPTRPEALRDDTCLQKNWKIPVDRIPRDLQPLFFKAGNKNVDVEMPALALDPLDQLEPLPGQPAAFAADKPLEFFFVFDHRKNLLTR
jgi:hypothetical protein